MEVISSELYIAPGCPSPNSCNGPDSWVHHKDRIFFGYASIFGDWNDEWGYFSLDELESYRGRFGPGIERDLHFGEKHANEVIKK